MANYLQRVIASGAMTSVAVRPPISSAPVVPLARPPMPQPGLDIDFSPALGQEHSAPEFPLSEPAVLPKPVTPPQPMAATVRSPDVAAIPQRAEVAAEEVNQPVAEKSPAHRLEKPAENRPPAPPSPAPSPSLAAASPVRMPSISHLPGVARGPRIQAPKGLRPLSGQPRAATNNVSSTQAESLSPLVVEHATAQVRESSPAETAATEPSLVATVHGNPSNRSQPPTPNAPREPVRAAIPAPVQTPAAPQPAREAVARPIAAVSRPQSRLNIGRIDVHVKNRPAAAPRVSQPSPASAGTTPFSALDALSMDRFSIKP